MVGRFGVGKTSLVRRFVESIFDDSYLTTVGVTISRKDVVLGAKTLTLVLWDLAGEDDLDQLKVSHLRGASGYILVADGCRSASFAKVIELNQRIIDQIGPLPFVLVLNKADLRDQWEVRDSDVAERGWSTFETSAKAGTGVEEMFHALAAKLLA